MGDQMKALKDAAVILFLVAICGPLLLIAFAGVERVLEFIFTTPINQILEAIR